MFFPRRLEEISLCHRCNSYKIPQMGEELLHRMGLLPIQVEATEHSIDFAVAFMKAYGGNVEVEVECRWRCRLRLRFMTKYSIDYINHAYSMHIECFIQLYMQLYFQQSCN